MKGATTMRNPQREAFLQAIRENPDDDATHLIYADWLDENDEPARAEFIRAQCEKAHLPRWHRRWRVLAWREKVLLARHEHTWRAELPEIPGVAWGAFERGFVHEVTVQLAKTLSDRAEEILQAAPVRWACVADGFENCKPLPFLSGLRIKSCGNDLDGSPDVVFGSPLLSTLKVLDLTGSNMEGEQFAALGRSPHLANLTTLHLDDSYMGNDNLQPLVESKQFRNLTTLSMVGNSAGYHEDARIRQSDVALLARSANLSRLTSLNLSCNELDTPSFCMLVESPHLSGLRELNLTRNKLTGVGIEALAGIDARMRLHSLNLSRNAIGDAGAGALARASFCKELADLDLDTCEITSSGVAALARVPWARRLGRLNLDHNSAGADGAYALREVLDGGQLYALHLRENELDAEAVKLLVEAGGASSLEILDISDNALDAAALEALALSPNLGRLRDLRLDGCQIKGADLNILLRAPWFGRLVRLSLSGNPIDDQGLQTLLTKGGLARLNELNLNNCGLTQASAGTFVAAKLPELHWLDLSRNALGPAGAEALARSGLPANLVELKLDGNLVEDRGAAALAAAAWPLLTFLALGSNGLKEEGVLALSRAANLSRVGRIRLRDTRIHYNTQRGLGPRFEYW
jgi:uncharacterized protein (TIGR02996 family)